MKKLIPLITMQALLLSVFSGAAFAQPSFAQEDEQSAKNLYLAHARDSKRGRPGVKITIELKRGEKMQKVPLNYSFRAGDKVKFHFETNFNAYVKIINIGSTGALQLLYPYSGANELVTRTKDYAVPQGDLWFEFDRNPGTERLTFVFSAKPLLAETQTASAAPRPNQGSVTPTRPSHSEQSNSDQQQALADLNSRSLENGKDFTLVEDRRENENCAYGVAPARILRKPIGVRIDLSHK